VHCRCSTVADLAYLLRLVVVLAVIIGGVGWLVLNLPVHPLIIMLVCIPGAWALLDLVQP
jgi:hypothetical protein